MAKRYRYIHKPYSLFPKKMTSGNTIFYYQARDDSGKRQNPKTTGIGFSKKKDEPRARKEAEAYCDTLFEFDNLHLNNIPTLAEWIESKHFWDWKRSSYVKSILVRSPKEKPGITETYIKKGDQATRDHIIPYHGNIEINKITPFDCEQLLFNWVKNGVSHKTANNFKSIYSVMLSEYERELKMKNQKADYFNPWKMVRPLIHHKVHYGGLTLEEGAKILSSEGVDFSNSTHKMYYYAIKIAFNAGLRMGEVVGLYTNDIIDVFGKDENGNMVRLSYLKIKYQWSHGTWKRTLVKNKEMRRIPIKSSLRDELNQFLEIGPGHFVFSHRPQQDYPINGNRLREWLYKRMYQIGISEEMRKERNLALHSARRYFNTLLRNAGVSDHIIRKFTGHKSPQMTEDYTDYLPEDLLEITKAIDLIPEVL